MLLTVGMRAERLASTHQYITDEQRAEPDKHLNAHLNSQFLKLFRSVVVLIMQGRFVFTGFIPVIVIAPRVIITTIQLFKIHTRMNHSDIPHKVLKDG